MKQFERAKDNQDSRASIAILCSSLPTFFAFESLYKNLENVEFVLDFTALPRGIFYPEWQKNRTRTFLKNAGVYFRDIEGSELNPEEFFSKYHTLVCVSFDGLITHSCNQKKKKIRVLTDIDQDFSNPDITNVYFDLIACPSENIAKKLTALYGVRAIVTGIPKYDCIVAPHTLHSEVTIDQNKKNVLYAPTWGNFSSEEDMIPVLLELSAKYNIFYAPHSVTALSRSELIRNLDISSIKVLGNTVCHMDVLKKVDLVITDNLSGVYDAIAAEKSLVIVNKVVEKLHKKDFSAQLATMGKMLKEGNEIAPVVYLSTRLKNDLSFASRVETAMESADKSVFKQRQKVHADISSMIDGKSGERIGKSIGDLIEHYSENTKSELAQHVQDFKDQIEEKMVFLFEQKRKEDVLNEEKISHIKNLPLSKKMIKIAELFY